MNPSPGARTTLDGQMLKVWRGVALEGRAMPGSIVEARQASLLVGCGQGILRLEEVQPAGAKRMSAQAFLAGRTLAVGKSLG
jgi:methionyl-tRNA formyltransferase